MKRLLAFLAAVPIVVFAQTMRPHAYVPPNGFVPDSATAVRIAVAIWTPIYGEQQIAAEQPYHAQLRAGTWTVSGSLPPNHVGGVAVAEIAKRDARVLRVSHGL